MQTTRWLDKSENQLDDIINSIMSYKVEENILIGDINFLFEKVFETNQTIVLNEKNILFNKIKFKYDSVIDGEQQPIEDRTTQKDGFIIIYDTGQNINYITSKSISEAKTFLRKLNNYSEKNIILENMTSYDNNFFLWLIKKIYTNNNIIPINLEREIEIKSVKGFRGKTSDSLTKIKADGETVLNVISTLAFLLESKNINQMTIEFEYGLHENIELKINTNGTIYTDINSYTGILLDEEYEIRTTYLILLIYLELLPKIYQEYKSEFNNNRALEQKAYQEFIELIKKDVIDRIENII